MHLIRCPAVVVLVKILFVSQSISPTGALPVRWTGYSNELSSNQDDGFRETLEQELLSPLTSKDDDIYDYTSIESGDDNAANSNEGSGSGESNITESISSGYGGGGSEIENGSGEEAGNSGEGGSSGTESGSGEKAGSSEENGNSSGSGSGEDSSATETGNGNGGRSAEESGSGESDDEKAKENHPSNLVIGEGNMSGEETGGESSSEHKESGEGAGGSNSVEGSGEMESGSGLIFVNNGSVVLAGGVLRIPTSEPVHTTTAVIDDPLSALLQFLKEIQAGTSHKKF